MMRLHAPKLSRVEVNFPCDSDVIFFRKASRSCSDMAGSLFCLTSPHNTLNTKRRMRPGSGKITDQLLGLKNKITKHCTGGLSASLWYKMKYKTMLKVARSFCLSFNRSVKLF